VGKASSKKSTVHETRLVLQNVLLEFQAGDSSSVAEVDRLWVHYSSKPLHQFITHHSICHEERLMIWMVVIIVLERVTVITESRSTRAHRCHVVDMESLDIG